MYMTTVMKRRSVHTLRSFFNKEAFDKRGLIYGMGHAIYLFQIHVQKYLKAMWNSLQEKRAE